MEKSSWGPECTAHASLLIDLHTVEARGGDAPDFKLRGLSKDIFGFELFMIPGFFRVKKFGKCFFGWLDLKQSEIRGSARRSASQSSANKVQPNLLRLGNSACMDGIFGGFKICGPGWFCWKP